MTHQWKRFGVYANDMGGTVALVEGDGQYVLAEDAIKREAELLTRIADLEQRAAQAAELVSKAVGMMVP